MDLVKLDHRPEGLRTPTLVAAFEGWNDAGEAATGALEALEAATGAKRFAEIDAEEFYDFQVSRPVIRWDGDDRVVDWPSNTLSAARLDGDRDVVFLRGCEPNLRWRTFVDTILRVASDLDVAQVVTLGALQVDLPHTRKVSLTGAASDAEVASRHGLRRSSYEGPTGIVGILHQAATLAELDTVTFWVGVPHYLSGTAYLRASLALAEQVQPLLGTTLPLESLAEDAEAQMVDIADLVEEDPELAEYVVELERRADSAPNPMDTSELPTPPVSGDELAREFERYLRDRPVD